MFGMAAERGQIMVIEFYGNGIAEMIFLRRAFRADFNTRACSSKLEIVIPPLRVYGCRPLKVSWHNISINLSREF